MLFGIIYFSCIIYRPFKEKYITYKDGHWWKKDLMYLTANAKRSFYWHEIPLVIFEYWIYAKEEIERMEEFRKQSIYGKEVNEAIKNARKLGKF